MVGRLVQQHGVRLGQQDPRQTDHGPIADRAGFNPGSGGRTVITCLKTVRRDWPHLQWWRAVPDNGRLPKEQEQFLIEAGFETEAIDDDSVLLKSFEQRLMTWEEVEEATEDSPVETDSSVADSRDMPGECPDFSQKNGTVPPRTARIPGFAAQS